MVANLRKIQEQFNEVIAYSQTGISNPQTDELFDRWLEAKRGFIEAFGGELIVECPKMTFTLTDEEKQKRIDDFCQTVAHTSGNELVDFIKSNKEGFFQNQVMFQYDNEAFKIPKGMKLVKSFKYFEPDPDTLAKLQSAASMLIQENNVSGTLCLSVHPLDYLSASENNHHWRSCHSLDGDYRSGNLSYMVDESTIICYIKTNDDEYLQNFPESVPWNSKKWRVWLSFTSDWKAVFAGRQYPFSSIEAMEYIREEMFSKYNLGKFESWTESNINYVENHLTGEMLRTRYPYIILGGYIRPLHQVVVNAPGSLQFNDLLSSSNYIPMYAQVAGTFKSYYPSGFTAPLESTAYIGGKVKCLRCGKEDIELSGSMLCTSCELLYGDCLDDSIDVCPCCGERYMYDMGVYIPVLDNIICPDCADNCCTRCEVCGDLIPNEYISYDKKDRYICRDCVEWEAEEIYQNRAYEKERL